MRKLRTVITMLVVMAMLLTSAGIPAFAASFSDITDQRVSDAVDKLVGFKIITGYEDGTFKPDNQITRAEFAAIVTRMKGVADNLGTDAVTGFSDLDNDASRAWARPYVKAAVDLKIINGFEDGTFRAGEPVTYEQAVKMLVCAVGYEVVAQSEFNKIKVANPNATWSAGYIAAANKHGITKGVITNLISEPASRGVVAVLTSNGLEVPEIKENEDGSFEKVEVTDKNDKNIEEIKGIVSETFYTGLNAENTGLSQNEIVIGIGEEKETYELSAELKKQVDLEDLIGKNVVAYYDKLDNQITQIMPRGNATTIIKEQDVISINGNTVRFYNASGDSDSVSLSGYTMIYNGKYYPAADLENDFRNGQIELIESGKQKIAKVTSYEVFVVQSFDKTNEKIFLKYGKKYNNGSGDENFYQLPQTTTSKPTFYVGGKVTEFSSLSLAAYDVINYFESPGSERKIKKMYITKGGKSGKVTSDLGEERIVELNNTKVYLTNDYVDYETGYNGSSEEKAPFEIGDSYTYYLDYTGQLAAVKYNSASQGTYKYGYVSGAGKVGSTYVVDIVSVDNGTVTRYELTSSIKIDGTPVNEKSVADTLATTKNNITNTYSNTSDVAQPVRFETSGSTLKAIDTLDAGTGGAGDNFTKNVNGDVASTVTKSSVKQGGNSYSMLSSTTKVLYVPDDVTDTSSYAKLALADAARATYVEVFNVGSDKVAPYVIVYAAANPAHVFVANSPYMIVTGTSFSGDEMTITGYKNAGTSPTPITVDPEYYKGSAISGGIDNYDDDVYGVKKGDLIRYIENNGKIIAIEIWYDASHPVQEGDYTDDTHPVRVENKKNGEDDPNSRFFRYGMVHAASNETKLIALSKYIASDSASSSDKADSTNSMYFKIGSAKIYELDSTGNVTNLSELPSLNVYSEGADTASNAIVISSYNVSETPATVIYIVK